MHEYKVIITNHALHSMTEIRDYIAMELLNPSAAISHLELYLLLDFKRRGCRLCYRCDLRRKRSAETA